jgi:hypothetical protein
MKKIVLLMLVVNGFLCQTRGNLPSKTLSSGFALGSHRVGKSIDILVDIFKQEGNALDIVNGMWVQYSNESFNVFKVKKDGTVDKIINNHPLPSIKKQATCSCSHHE